MERRTFLSLSAVGLGSITTSKQSSILPHIRTGNNSSDIIVIGAGVFGVWTAFYLQELGAKVTLIDAYGPGNSRASSGGESRILRADYGERMLYTHLNNRAFQLWDQWQKEWKTRILLPTGRLTLGNATYKAKAMASKKRLDAIGVEGEILTTSEIKYRWPQINADQFEVGFYFPAGPGGSTLMAREACRLVGEQFQKKGGEFLIGQARPGKINNSQIESILLDDGTELKADQYIFACGPWMAQLFPQIIAPRLKVYRRDVLFVGPAAGDQRYSFPHFPVWGLANENYYGVPDIDGRGFKVAPFPDMNSIDMDKDERLVNLNELKRTHEFVERVFPGLKGQPILETRVCQLSFTPDEHFIVDQHPAMDNVFLLAGGSGHGFKHGPAFGEYVAKRIYQQAKNEVLDLAFRLKEATH